MKTATAFFLLLFFGMSISNAATIIDFESTPLGTAGPLTFDGFTFSGIYPYQPGSVSADADGNHRFGAFEGGFTDDYGWSQSTSFTLTRAGGGAFAYYGADVTSFAGFAEPSVVGVKVGGGFAADPIGTGDWLYLEQVSFSIDESYPGGVPWGQGLWVDNVQLRAVPIPAAAWLFGSALAGLGWLRRKQTV